MIRFLTVAADELDAAAQWYENRLPGLGTRFLKAAIDASAAVEKHPTHYPVPPAYRASRNVRQRMLDAFPYAIIYEIREAELLVLAVAHVSRRPGYWTNRGV